jgi:hypothetical protein
MNRCDSKNATKDVSVGNACNDMFERIATKDMPVIMHINFLNMWRN